MSLWNGVRTWTARILNATFGAGHEAFWREVGWLGSDGNNVTPDTVLSIAAVWKAVNVIGKDIATLPLHKYQRLDPQGKDRVRDFTTQLLNSQANLYTKSVDHRLAVQVQALLRGNGYAEIQRDPTGKPLALWWLPSENVSATVDEAGWLWYVYRQGLKPERRIRPENMLHIKGPSKDGLTGWGTVELARESLSLTMGQEKYAKGQYDNGVRPSVMVKIPGNPTAEKRKEFRREFENSHAGASKAFGTMLLYNGMEASPWSMSNEDAQWLEGRQFQVEEIARWFDLPPHKLGAMDRATWANVEQMQMEYVGGCLQFWLTQWQQECNAKLLTEREKLADRLFYEFKTEALLRGDTLSRYQVYAIGIANRILNPNECRDKENMNAYEGGDDYENPNTASPNAAGDPTDRREEQDDGNRNPRTLGIQSFVLAEVELIENAAEVSKNFVSYIDKFYQPDRRWHLRAAEAFGSVEVAHQWCRDSHDKLMALTETVTQRELPAAVTNLLADWPQRAEQFCVGVAENAG